MTAALPDIPDDQSRASNTRLVFELKPNCAARSAVNQTPTVTNSLVEDSPRAFPETVDIADRFAGAGQGDGGCQHSDDRRTAMLGPAQRPTPQ
jgi:hypothetical protein